EPGERQHLLESYLCEQVAAALGIATSELDVHHPLNTLGIDSLMALELKNRVEFELGEVVPVVKLLQGPSIAQLTTDMLDQLKEEAAVPPIPLAPEATQGLEDAEQLLEDLD